MWPLLLNLTSAPDPPSSLLRDQHMVVRSNNTLCVCTPCWAYALRDGIEPSSAALALPESALPRRRVVLTSRSGNYLLVLIQQCRQPGRFLYLRIQFSILLGQIISFPLNRSNAHCANELNFRARHAALRCQSRGG